MRKSNEFLASEPVGSLLRKLAVPTVMAQLINMLYNVVDRIYIGHIPVEGAMALTGVGVCFPVIMIVSAFAALISQGGAPRASIYMGEGGSEPAERTLGSCFSAQLIISAILTFVLLRWNGRLLMSFGASENTIGYAVEYMDIYAMGTVFVQLTLGMNSFITAQGFTKTSMATVLIGAVLNIVLDPLFIFAFNMGVRGAALATIISQGVSCVWVLCFLCGKKTLLHLRAKYLRVDGKYLFPSVYLGLASFVMQASESVIFVCYNASLLKYGGDMAVGAMTILSSVMQFAMMPLHGLGQGAQPIISYNYGAKNRDRVHDTYFLLLKVSMIYSVILWGLIMICPGMLAGIFTPDEELLTFTARALRIYCGASVLFGIQIACQSAFIAIGSAAASIIVAVVRKFVLILPLIYLMPAVFPADKTMAVYTSEPVADVIAVTFTAILFYKQFKKALQSLE